MQGSHIVTFIQRLNHAITFILVQEVGMVVSQKVGQDKYKTEEQSVNRTCIPSDALDSKVAASTVPSFRGCEIEMEVACGQFE